MDVKELTSEELANIVRTINSTGISPTRYKKECLTEAAERLEKLDRIEKWVRGYTECQEKKQNK